MTLISSFGTNRGRHPLGKNFLACILIFDGYPYVKRIIRGTAVVSPAADGGAVHCFEPSFWRCCKGCDGGGRKQADSKDSSAGNTDKQLRMMMDMKSTVLCATSSYALLLAEEIAKRGIGERIHLRKGVIGSERWGEKMRNRIASELGVDLFDIYGLTEVYGPRPYAMALNGIIILLSVLSAWIYYFIMRKNMKALMEQ